MTLSVVGALKNFDTDLFLKLHATITEESFYRYLKPLADTYSPSQSASWTRAHLLQSMLAEDGYSEKENFKFARNFQRTGNSVILLGQDDTAKQIWLLAHLDQITYLIEDHLGDRYSLMPICYHLMEPGERGAVAVAYDLETNAYEVIDKGKILCENQDDVFYLPGSDKPIRPGIRVCFESQMTWNHESGEIRGSLDDAAGVVALVEAVKFLADYDVELVLGLTDEEEGKAGFGNQTICRGGARLLRYFNQPDLVIASDIHEAADMYGGGGPDDFKIGDGASFAEKAAKGLGTITPPHIYELMKQMANELAGEDIRLRENLGGYLSRTESVNAMVRTPNVALMGFLGENRHFQRDLETGNIKDLVDLAKSVVCLVLFTQTQKWQQMGL